MCLRSCDVRSQMERKSSQSSQLAETTVVVSAAHCPPGKGYFLAQLGRAHLPEPSRSTCQVGTARSAEDAPHSKSSHCY